MADGLRPNVEADTSTPDLPPRQKMLTVDEFLRMGELGLLNEEGKHELWDGRIMMTPPPGGKHMGRERRIVRALILAIHAAGLDEEFGVQTGGGLKIGEHNFRGPDVMVLRLPVDEDDLLTGDNVSLIIEVANSSLPDDLREKRSKYAGAGIPEYWVVDVKRGRLHAFRNPKAGDYPECEPLEAGATISPLFSPQITLAVADLV